MAAWSEELELIRARGLYRELKSMESAQTPRTVVEGRELIMLASNNYLGLSNNPQIKEKTVEIVQEYGTGAGGSRLTTGNYDLHEQLEKELACFKESEAALIFNTGYMANLGVLTTVVSQGDLILSDELNHASIVDGCRLSRAEVEIYQHNQLADLEAKLRAASDYRRRLIVTDGVFSMDGDLAPLPGIVELAREYQALVMVDDAHGTGVLGERGAGIVEYFGLADQVDIQLGTLSKALAAEGGFVAGSEELIDLLRNRARPFIYSTALAPGTIGAALASLEYLQQRPEIKKNLVENVELLKIGLEELGYQVMASSSAIIPILIGDQQQTMSLSEELLKEGVLAPGIRPPTVAQGSSRIRTTVMATHSREDIEAALLAFAKAGERLGIIA